MSNYLPEDRYFQQLTKDEIWQRYCGFLDLSMSEFMDIQNELLMDEIDLVFPSILGKKMLGDKKPGSVNEFRKQVPITTYNDYEPYLSDRNEEVLAIKPEFWCHSSGRGGYFKWFPQNKDFFNRGIRASIGSFILASAQKKKEVNIEPGWRFLNVSAPIPYGSGYTVDYLQKNMTVKVFPDPTETSHLPFEERFNLGFTQSLKSGVDIIGALSSILVRMGEIVGGKTGSTKISLSSINLRVIYRYISAMLRSRREKRNILPKDLWPTKAIIAYGMDTDVYQDAIKKYWGVEPFVIYGCTEGLFISMQSWSRKYMTFLPNMVFFEFIPYSNKGEPVKDENNPYGTVLLNELEPGKLYEPVITQSCGMPLMRYRMFDLVKVVSLSDPETGIRLPQITFQRRVDEIINLAGLTQLDEKTIWQAIMSAGIQCTDWAATKDFEDSKGILHIYLEPKNADKASDMEISIDRQLQMVDTDYKDIGSYLEQQPVKVTLLSKGTFAAYTQKKVEEGADMAHLKPKRINPTEESLKSILKLSAELGEETNDSAK